jgi:hypothetical protein
VIDGLIQSLHEKLTGEGVLVLTHLLY